MPISFGYIEPRNRLEINGFVYSLRPFKRKRLGFNWYNYYRNGEKQGDVSISFIGDFLDKDQELEEYVIDSGFNSLGEWLKKAKIGRYLYKVILLKFNCSECKYQCKRQVLIHDKFYGVYLYIDKDRNTLWVRRECPDFSKKNIGGLI